MQVSVVIAAYNAEAYIAEAIESVLGQTVPPGEVIVIDDGSIDGTRGILDRFGDRIVALAQDNSGQAIAVNKALARARGELIGFCDADDLLRASWSCDRHCSNITATSRPCSARCSSSSAPTYRTTNASASSRPSRSCRASLSNAC